MKDLVSELLTDPESLRRGSGFVTVKRSTVPEMPSPACRLPRLRELASSPEAVRAIQRVRPVEPGQGEDEFNSSI